MAKLTADETVLGLAAAVNDRATELITEGWTKGKMRGGSGGVQSFCIHGALNFALDELLPGRECDSVRAEVEQVAVAFICDEAFGSMKQGGSIPAARFNDASERHHQEVIDVMERATQRLWSVTFDTASMPAGQVATPTYEFSQWAGVDEGEATKYLNVSLVN